MTDRDEELAEAIEELTRTIEDLRVELDESRRSPPRVPTPSDLFRFSEEVALPALIAGLESAIRALEVFQRGLAAARSQRELRDQVRETGAQATDLRRTTLAQLETVLDELQLAATDGHLPTNDEASQLLTDARELRDQVDQRLQDVTAERTRPGESGDDGGVRIEVADGEPEPADDEESIDVDAELETLKDRYAEDASAESDTADEEAAGEDESDTADEEAAGEDESDTADEEAAGEDESDTADEGTGAS